MDFDKPNIVLINCDDLGFGDLGCYGSQANKTPAIDHLAANGMKFTDFYVTAPVCSPARGSLMTGCYPRRIGFDNFDGHRVLFPGQAVGLNPDEITIADILKKAGYSTMIVGKWHCGDQEEFLPTRHGFDHYYGVPYSNDMGRQAGRDPKRFPPLPLLNDEEVLQEQPDQASLTERYVEQAVRFIRTNKGNSFFLYLAHMHVHLPHYTPERFYQQSDNGEYGAAVECIDWATSVIMDELKEQGIADNTLVIFTSDNGSRARDEGGSNKPLRGTKGTTWEGGMRVPCIMHWPGKIPNNVVCNELVTVMDFLPTLANLAGEDIPTDRTIDGKNIKSLIFAEENAASPYECLFYYNSDKLEAVRAGNWKLHIRKGDEQIKELYNLDSDISESKNLYNQYPAIVADLLELINQCRLDLGDGATNTAGRDTRSLGRVANPKMLTAYDPNHPYIIALYDKENAG